MSSIFCKLTFLLSVCVVSVSGQVAWNFTDGLFSASTTPANITVSNLTAVNVGNGSASINSTSVSDLSSSSGGNNLAMSATAGGFNLTTSSYYEFTLTPAEGYGIKASSFSLSTRSTSTGPTSIGLVVIFQNESIQLGSVVSSTTGSWSNKLIIGPSTTITLPVNASVAFRIYGSGGSSSPSQANWRLDDISFDVVALTQAELDALYPATVPEPAQSACLAGMVCVFVALVSPRRRPLSR
jgi:hypothetical protein